MVTGPDPTQSHRHRNGLGGICIIDSVALRTGLSLGVVRGSLAVIVPLLIHHMVSNNHVSPTGEPIGSQPESGNICNPYCSAYCRAN